MKTTIISILIALGIITLAIFFVKSGKTSVLLENANNVSVVDGKQIIEINARGGYSPRKSVAKAGIPTVLRFNTGGTFDCSASVLIPSLGISKLLPQSGVTDIDIGTEKVTTLQGMCGMGMYRFEVEFLGG